MASTEDMVGSLAYAPGCAAATAGPSIDIRHVSRSFIAAHGGVVQALADIDFVIDDGEFVALLGPSGSGKSTLLRLLAALDEPSTGTITVHGNAPRDLARDHRLGVAFQDHALLPWLSIFDNIALPFRIAGRPIDRTLVDNLLWLVGLTDFANARPRELSGGMRQRASIARALVLDPALLLLDEPFGALDSVTRRHLNVELQRIWMESRKTTVLVTHDVSEAVFLADRILVLSARPGRIVTIAKPDFARPRSPDIMRMPEFHALVDELTDMLDGHS